MPRYIGPFEVLKRVGTVAYQFALSPSLSSVHAIFHVLILQKYTPYPTHVVDWGELVVDADGTFEEGSMSIMDSRDQVLRGTTVRLVKVLWQYQRVDEATWEYEDIMRANYPFLFKDEGMFLVIWWLLHIHVIGSVCVCEFWDKIIFKGGRMLNPGKIEFF